MRRLIIRLCIVGCSAALTVAALRARACDNNSVAVAILIAAGLALLAAGLDQHR